MQIRKAQAPPLARQLVSEPSNGGEESERLGTRLEWPGLFSFVFCFVFFGSVAHNSAASRGIVVTAVFLIV